LVPSDEALAASRMVCQSAGDPCWFGGIPWLRAQAGAEWRASCVASHMLRSSGEARELDSRGPVAVAQGRTSRSTPAGGGRPGWSSGIAEAECGPKSTRGGKPGGWGRFCSGAWGCCRAIEGRSAGCAGPLGCGVAALTGWLKSVVDFGCSLFWPCMRYGPAWRRAEPH